LKFAINHGYKIKVIKGYNFNKENNVFDEYVYDLYKTKSVSKGSIRVIVKSLLNNLLGRFGLDINKPVTEIVSSDKLNLILSTREVIGKPTIINDDNILINYNPSISKEICD
jgi:arsenate reductase-like glutaredoxin family protein